MEWTTLAVAGMSLIGTLAGTFGGMLAANKLEGRMTEAEHDIRDLKGAA